MKKRIISVLLVVSVLLSLCSCVRYSPVSVNGTKIGNGIYTYFFDSAKMQKPSASENEIKDLAYKLISQYVAINSEFEARELKLSVAEKAEVSDSVNVYWQYFSKYYEDLGVNKQDYYQIKLNECYREKLMEYYYSAQGEAPVSDQELKDYFNKNFVAFRAVTSFLTTVDENNETVSLPENERKDIIDVFNKMSAEINEGKSSLEVVASYEENTIITNETVVIGKDSTDYPEGFFENVMKLGNDKAGSFVIGDYIFTVQRNDINSQELNLFAKYKMNCLKALKADDFSSVIDYWSQFYLVEE